MAFWRTKILLLSEKTPFWGGNLHFGAKNHRFSCEKTHLQLKKTPHIYGGEKVFWVQKSSFGAEKKNVITKNDNLETKIFL